ncbi:MAG: collagen binding domain-containing protein [Lachnospirales bacterium]
MAKNTNLPNLLTHLCYQVKRIGSYHTTKEMDSLRIKNRRTWFRYSENVGGYAISFLRRFCGKTFPEAAEYQLSYHGRARDSPTLSVRPNPASVEQPKDPVPFALPPPHQDSRRVFAYLRKRGIAITAQLQITKKSADYNPTNGLPAGTLLEGAVFEIYDKANNLVDTIRSNDRGLAVSKPLPPGLYAIREVKAPANYGITSEVLNAYLEHEGQILRFEVTNKALSTGVSITKTGPREIMAGQPVRYTFSGGANTSNVRLDSFYWRDTIPAQVRLDQAVTGTYNFPGTYKIVCRVNGGKHLTLVDNLSTGRGYVLDASAAALGLASNERVTEVVFVFGQAPAGFAQVEKPYIHCTAVGSLPAGSFINVADVTMNSGCRPYPAG